MFFNKDADGKGSPLVKRRTVPLLPLRDIIVFPHMVVAALRRARAVDQRARRGDGARQGHLPRRAEEREDQRADAGGHLRRRHARHGDAAAPPARRHREGARRGQAAREDQALRADRRVLPRRGRGDRGGVAARRRGRGADAQRAGRLRDLREAEQEGSARSLDERADDRRSGAPLRHDRREPADHQARRSPAAARDGGRLEAPRASARADAGRDRDSPGGEEDPLARQEADGEDAEGILPERADAGHPEGAGRRRARRVQERDPGDRGDAQDQADEQGGHRARSRRSSRSSR